MIHRVALPHHPGASKLPRKAGGLGAPKLRRSVGGFTLLEIMIVVSIVAVLSMLAVAAIKHLQQRAARSTILNNLRQLHEAKEHFFFETGSAVVTTAAGLAREGYLRASVRERVMSGATFEAHQGWHYGFFLMPGQPTYAYQGQNPGKPVGGADASSMTWTQTTGEVIWYPAPPAELATVGSTSTTSTASGSAATTPVQATPPAPASPRLPPTHDFGNIRRSGGSWDNDTGFLYQLGLHTPADRAGLTITEIKFTQPGVTATKDPRSGYWQISGTSGHDSLDFTLTITNAQGGVSTVRASAPVR